jgi:hypothetical protein
MAGNLFAFAVLALVGLTLALLKPFGERPTIRSTMRGLAGCLASFFVLITFASLHLCHRCVPVMAIWGTANSIR